MTTATQTTDTVVTSTAQSLVQILNQLETLSQQTVLTNWNVTGPNFLLIQTLTDEFISEQSILINIVAERIRTLGVKIPITFAQTQVSDVFVQAQSTTVLTALKQSAQNLIKQIQETIRITNEQGDNVTENLLITGVAQLQRVVSQVDTFQS